MLVMISEKGPKRIAICSNIIDKVNKIFLELQEHFVINEE